jgi:serine/threonine-protein kinase
MRILWLVILVAGCDSSNGNSGTTTGGTTGGTTTSGTSGGIAGAGRGIFPSSAPWYTDVSSATPDAKSADVINGLAGAGGWGNNNTFQIDFSIEVLSADASVARRSFTQTGDFFSPDCDPAPMPVPPGGRLEGESDYHCSLDGDCHLLVMQGTRLYEMWRADISGGQAVGGTFNGGCLAIWDLTRDYWAPAAPPNFSRGDQCTSADAAGYPIAALLFNADEVAAGEIKHSIRFILPNDRIDPTQYVHPATHATRHTATATTPVPYGARLRLKSTFNVDGLPSEGAKVVARALQKYGMFLADGGNIALTGEADTYTTAKWNGLLDPHDLGALAVMDFEMVDGGTRIPLTLDCSRTPMTN